MKPTTESRKLNELGETQLDRSKRLDEKGFAKMVARATGKRKGCWRWFAAGVLGLVVTSSALGQVKAQYGYSAGSAVQPVVATTAPVPCCRGAYIVTMSQDGTGGPMELRAWNDAGTYLVRIGTATWAPGTGASPFAYAIATLDANHVVAAYVDNSSTLYVGVWMVGATNPSPFYLEGIASAPASGSFGPVGPTGLAIVALSATQVVTAGMDPANNLRMQTWAIDAAGGVTLEKTEVGEQVGAPEVFMVAMSATQVVTAIDTPSGHAMRVWQIGNDGAFTREGDWNIDGGDFITNGIAVAPLGGLLGNYEVMTNYTNNVLSDGVATGTNILVKSWNITSAGLVSLGESGTGTSGVSQSAIAWTPSVNPLTVSLADGEAGAEPWKYNGTSWAESGPITFAAVPYPDMIAIAPEGTGGGNAYYAAAYVDSAGNLRVEVLSYTP